MAAPIDSYRVTAKHYDCAYAAKPDLVDIPFYLDLAEQSGGPVLEIACGTGRVLIPIARRKIAINGVDNSLPMLQVLRNSLANETDDVRQRVTLNEGDMRDFSLGVEFPLVIIPFRPMQHMHTLQDQISALVTGASHLRDNGLLAFDVFYPKFELMNERMGEEVKEMEWSSKSDPNTIVQRYFRKDSVDKINQIFNFVFIYRTFRDSEMILEEKEDFKLSYFTYPHLRALFLLAGLEPVAEYGSFAKDPLNNHSEQMIFVLRRARNT